MSDYTIRLCGLQDLALLCRISAETFHETFSGQNSEEDMAAYIKKNFSEEQLTQELSEPESIFFVAQNKGRAVAYMKLNAGQAQTEPGHEKGLEIQRIYVLKSHKRRGIGTLLVEKAEETARRKGLDHIWLGVWERNLPAIRFYGRHGFRRFGQHVFLLGEDAQTDHLFKKELV